MTDRERELEQRIRELEADLARMREAFVKYVHENGLYSWSDAAEVVDRLSGKDE